MKKNDVLAAARSRIAELLSEEGSTEDNVLDGMISGASVHDRRTMALAWLRSEISSQVRPPVKAAERRAFRPSLTAAERDCEKVGMLSQARKANAEKVLADALAELGPKKPLPYRRDVTWATATRDDIVYVLDRFRADVAGRMASIACMEMCLDAMDTLGIEVMPRG
jgi:hypothetical protein